MSDFEKNIEIAVQNMIKKDEEVYTVRGFAYKEEERPTIVLFSGKLKDSLERLKSKLPSHQENEKIKHVKNKPSFVYDDLEISYSIENGEINLVINPQVPCKSESYDENQGQVQNYLPSSEAHFYDYISFDVSERGEVSSISSGVLVKQKKEILEVDEKGLFKIGSMNKTDKKIKKLIEKYELIGLSKSIADSMISYADKFEAEKKSNESVQEKQEDASFTKEIIAENAKEKNDEQYIDENKGKSR